MKAKLTIKEVSGHTTTPSYESQEPFDEDFLIDFFGLKEDDVVEYTIEWDNGKTSKGKGGA